jgi:hypothetical protein
MCKPKLLPFIKLDAGITVLRKSNEIFDEFYRYYSEQFQEQSTNMLEPYKVEVDE